VNKFKRKMYEFKTSPEIIYNSDLYIVEFPKSGITWFSTILARLFYIKDKRGKIPTHFNLEQIIGDVHQNKNIQIPNLYPYHRTIKSHAMFNAKYRNVIYLMRNPFSVMKSYYNFSTSRNKFSGSFESFVKSPEFGIQTWVNHVNSWIYPIKEPNFQLIKYEDISLKPLETLSTLFDSLGFGFSREEVEEAVEFASFERMKVDNDRYIDLNPFRRYDFVHSGSVSAELEGHVYDYIREKSSGIVERFYPDLL